MAGLEAEYPEPAVAAHTVTSKTVPAVEEADSIADRRESTLGTAEVVQVHKDYHQQ